MSSTLFNPLKEISPAVICNVLLFFLILIVINRPAFFSGLETECHPLHPPAPFPPLAVISDQSGMQLLSGHIATLSLLRENYSNLHVSVPSTGITKASWC